MKKHIYIASLVLVALVAVSTQAQSRSNQQLRFKVPFAFNVGNNLLPAGDYRVTIVNPSSDHSVLRITSSDGKSTMIRTIDVEGWAAPKAKLSFRHYGDRYFLAQVWMAGESTGLATPTSRAEKSLQEQIGRTKNDVVAINAF